MGLRIIPRQYEEDASEGRARKNQCLYEAKKGGRCKGKVIAHLKICVVHLRAIGGHLWIFDRNDPQYRMKADYERKHFCRACGTVKNRRTTFELCPERAGNPRAKGKISRKLPRRLQYRLSRPENGIILTIDGQSTKTVCVGPFAIHRTKPDDEGRNWRIFHIPSSLPVALLTEKRFAVWLAKRLCRDGCDLDFTNPMLMDADARMYLRMHVKHHHAGKCIPAPNGIFAWDTSRPYKLLWGNYGSVRKLESWGPFVFDPQRNGNIALSLFGEYSERPIFEVRPWASGVAFAKAAAKVTFTDWGDEDELREGPLHKTIARFLKRFPGVTYW